MRVCTITSAYVGLFKLYNIPVPSLIHTFKLKLLKISKTICTLLTGTNFILFPGRVAPKNIGLRVVGAHAPVTKVQDSRRDGRSMLVSLLTGLVATGGRL